MKMRSPVPMTIAKTGYILVSVALIAAGCWMIAMPQISVAVIERFLGIAMIAFGIVKLVGYFSKDLFRLAFQYDLEFGILLLVLGAIALLRPNHVLNFLCIAIGICMLTEGLFKVKIAKQSRAFGIRGWWAILTLAILTAIVGLVLIVHPSESVAILTALVGASLIVEGIQNLIVVLSAVKIIKNQVPDVVEADYYEICRD